MIDLQDATRRDDTYVHLTNLINGLQHMSVGQPLTWLYVWDLVKYKVDTFEDDEDVAINKELSEKDIFDMFWEDADKNGFTLEYGLESLDDAVYDWLMERNIIVDLYAQEQ